MSITFRLDKPFPKMVFSTCPTCGISNDPKDDILRRDSIYSDCTDCQGYGPDFGEEKYSMNVANGNGIFILKDIFNIADEEMDYCGSINPSTVLLKLSMYFNLQNGVKETKEEQHINVSNDGVSLGVKMIMCGRTLEQVERYIVKLKEIAEAAIEEGVNITWG